MCCIKRPSQVWFLLKKRLNLQSTHQTASRQGAVPPLACCRPPPASSLNLAHSGRAPQCCSHAPPPPPPQSHNSQSFPLVWGTSGCWNWTVLCVTSTPSQFPACSEEKRIIMFYSLNALLTQTLCVPLHFLWQDAIVDSVKDARSKASIGLAGLQEQIFSRCFFSISFNYDFSSLLQ